MKNNSPSNSSKLSAYIVTTATTVVGLMIVFIGVAAATTSRVYNLNTQAAPPQQATGAPVSNTKARITLYGEKNVEHAINTPYINMRWGDVTGDGVVNVIDAQRIARYVQGLDEFRIDQIWHADTDGDGVITQDDVTKILELEVGIITELPVINSSVYESANFGDLNNDGNVNSLDGLLVFQYLADSANLTALQLWVADVDGDNAVTEADATMILEFDVGIVDSFPVEQTGRDLAATAKDEQGNNITHLIQTDSTVDVTAGGNYRVLFTVPDYQSPTTQRLVRVQ